MVDFKTAYLVSAALLLLAGCVDQGQPLIAERSPDFSEPNPSVMPDGETHPRAKVTRPEPLAPKRRASQSNIPVERARVKLFAPTQYLVRPGDTLYSIAWRFELDHRMLGRLNDIAPPYTIHPGQVLNLKSSAPVQTRQVKPAAKPTRDAVVAVKKPAPVNSMPVQTLSSNAWVWPVNGKPMAPFTSNAKGLDFAITAQSAVAKACNAGEVVYAGNGIGGFSRLIIIRHDQELLSAYSFNGESAVAEQQRVKAGQKIADISFTGRGSQKLHFELRKHGKPINPGSIIR